MVEEHIFGLKTLSSVLKTYLKNRKDHTERWLLNQFNQSMDKSHSSIMVKDVKHEHFDSFLKTLSGSQASLRSYASRLNRFKAYIGLSERKVKENPEPTTKKVRQLERKIAEKEEALTLHRETIDLKDAEIKKLHGIIDTSNSKGMELEELKNLEATFEARKAEKEAELAELDKKIAEEEKTIENQRIFEIECPHDKGLVSLGNDCHTCNEYLNCPLSSRRPDLLNVKEEKEEEEYD